MNDEKDFLKSDYCTYCDGTGEYEGDQCEGTRRIYDSHFNPGQGFFNRVQI